MINEPDFQDYINLPDLERAVLGALLIDSRVVLDTVLTLPADAFYYPEHRTVYQAICNLSREGAPIDQLTVCEKIGSNSHEDLIASVIAETASTANIRYHRDMLIEKMHLRELLAISQSITGMLKNKQDSESIMTGVLDRLEGMRHTSEDFLCSVEAALPASHGQMMARFERESGVTGIPTGYRYLDWMTGGWQPGNYIVMAAPPSKGKSTFAMMEAMRAARHGNPVVIFSLEMSAFEIAERMISADAQVVTRPTRDKPKLTTSEWERITDSCSKLSRLPIVIDTTPGMNINELKMRAKLHKSRYGTNMFVVDYLQLMPGAGEKSRQLEVAAISQGLKALSVELNAVVMAVSQYSRPVRGQEDGEPQLNWLRDSGSIEQDANIVLLIHDPKDAEKDAYLADRRGDIPEKDRPALKLRMRQVMVKKNRNGPIGNVFVEWVPEHFRFTDL